MITGIYALVDPITNRVMYVGKSYDVKKRYDQHITGSTSNQKLRSYIYDLSRAGLRPRQILLEETSDLSEREEHWIKTYREKGEAVLNIMLVPREANDADEELSLAYLIAAARTLIEAVRIHKISFAKRFHGDRRAMSRLIDASFALQDIQDYSLSERAQDVAREAYHNKGSSHRDFLAKVINRL